MVYFQSNSFQLNTLIYLCFSVTCTQSQVCSIFLIITFTSQFSPSSLSLSLSLSFTTHLRINLMRAEQNREYKGMKSKKMKIKQHHHLSWLTTTYPNHADLFKYFLPHLPFKWIERMRERERETKEEMKLFFDEGSFFSSATRKKLPNVYKSCLKWFH